MYLMKLTENFLNLKKKQISRHRNHRVPKKMKPKRPTPRHITIKMAKVKEKKKILKVAREKQGVTHKGNPI